MAQVYLDRRDCENDHFPDVCLKCGKPATRRVKKTFNWMPGWVYITLLVHLLIFLVVAAITRKTLRAELPMCDEHRNHWFHRTVGVVGSLFLLIAGTVALVWVMSELSGPGGNPDAGAIIGLSIVGAAFLWIVAAVIVSLTAIRPTKIDERGMRLTGVSPVFVDAYEEQAREHRHRLPDLDRDLADRWNERRSPRRRDEEEGDRYRRDQPEGDRYRREDEKGGRERSKEDDY